MRRLSRFTLLLALAALACGTARAQDRRQQDDGLEIRHFVVRFKAVEDALRVVQPHLGSEGSVTLRPRDRVLTVHDEPDRLLLVEEALHDFDVPPRHVNVAVQLIMGLREDDDDDEAGPAPRGIDPGLRDTLLSTTRWDQYHLLGSAALTASEGEESTLMLGEDYRIRFAVDQVNPQHAVTRFDRFVLERGRAAEAGALVFSPIWDVVLNLQDNQLYVFGATRVEDSRKAIFLSITAGIVE